ncbi:MAG: DUF448 domain-containing protein [Acidimicrobiales bacterium]
MGCRTSLGSERLVRAVRTVDGTVVISRHAPGRGAWLCRDGVSDDPAPACVAAALRRRAFDRAFRQPVGDLISGTATSDTRRT